MSRPCLVHDTINGSVEHVEKLALSQRSAHNLELLQALPAPVETLGPRNFLKVKQEADLQKGEEERSPFFSVA